MPIALPAERTDFTTVNLHPAAGRTSSIPVLHVINGEYYSGAERVQDLLAGQLPGQGFDPGLACVKPGLFPQLCRTREAPLYRLPMAGRLDLRPVRELVRLIRREGYQLLHAHTPRTAMLSGLASAITGVPLVYHVHSPASRDSTHRWQNHINALIERISLSRASALIAVSESLAQGARRQGFAAEKVWVVPNGVPCPVARPPRPADQADWTLGTVALFRPRKGIEVLLGALAILRSRGMSVRLRAVGGFESPGYERLVKGHAAQLGLTAAVDWTGFASDVDGHLRQMDLFVLPSLFGEGLPMAVLEAMAAGVPVVASRVDGVPEVIRNGVDGLLVQPGDPLALAETISRIIRREIGWSAMQANALKRQGERFSDRSMAAGVAEVYRRVLSRKRTGD